MDPPSRPSWRMGIVLLQSYVQEDLSLSVFTFLSYPWPIPACSLPVGVLLFLGLRRLPLHFLRHKSWLLDLDWLCHISALLWGARVRDTTFSGFHQESELGCPRVTSEWQGYLSSVESFPPPAKVRKDFSPYITWQEFPLLGFWTDWSVTHGTQNCDCLLTHCEAPAHAVAQMHFILHLMLSYFESLKTGPLWDALGS